ncbi:FAD-dependent oxidoreductase [Nocardia sp. SYP-A9097]|uniref:NAD(P)/FAD-dependent oxidoreductase n=1 Tax=Nocardia sp. SYP-A9097 TaxID=2663237 RepID=UPI00129B68FA|nr:FAD-dependent oxidoreductase [Nocardia sp. SYP-A9097]MRH87591.1 FAD-dependent oxidoreductase [Nocardia sp. SYP-A9097]
MRTGSRVAVVGSGVAGLTAAWVLTRAGARVTVFEADPRLGGHAHTHRLRLEPGTEVAVDTGFIVHNDRTYPTLLRLFAELGIETRASDMSMSVRCDGCGLEYAGARGPSGLFARPAHATRGRYLRLLTEVPRFHRLARAALREAADDTETLGEFVRRASFSGYFTTHFLAPLVAAVWSCDPETALRYPARYLFTFLDHHGMLTVSGSPTWRTVVGGSHTYVAAIAAAVDTVHAGTPVRALERHFDGVVLRDDRGTAHEFDAAVVATHPDQALTLLTAPTGIERQVLSAMPYSVNRAILHTDESALPRAARARASWNYRLPACTAAPAQVLVTYDLTRLQGLPGRRLLLTLNDDTGIPAAAVLDRMIYGHPRYTPESVVAQQHLHRIGDARVAFAGAYHGWGFHEDGALSGLRAAEQLGARWAGRAVTTVATA